MKAVGGMQARKLLFNPYFLRAESRGRKLYNRHAIFEKDRKYFEVDHDVLPMAAL